MRFALYLVLPLLVRAIQAASETAKVYIFQQPELSTSVSIPTLSPEDAKLVIAQRLGNSQFYSLRDASVEALAHINSFGGPRKQLFDKDSREVRSQFLIVVDNVTPEVAIRYQKAWDPVKPAFEISNPSSIKERPIKFVDPERRLAPNNVPTNRRYWPDLSKVMVLPAGSKDTFPQITEILAKLRNEDVDVMIILLPKSRYSYDLYDYPTQTLRDRDAQLEEPIEELETSPGGQSNIFNQDRGKNNATMTYSTCYSANDTCQNATNNCSGHGQCFMKYNGSDTLDSCYTCECIPSINITLAADGVTELARRTYWGGAACQKEDISSPFWLIVGVTVVLMGVASAGIGMLFSIGEEKLPSVIGAGVSASKGK